VRPHRKLGRSLDEYIACQTPSAMNGSEPRRIAGEHESAGVDPLVELLQPGQEVELELPGLGPVA